MVNQLIKLRETYLDRSDIKHMPEIIQVLDYMYKSTEVIRNSEFMLLKELLGKAPEVFHKRSFLAILKRIQELFGSMSR